MVVIRKLKRTNTGKVLSPGRKLKRVLKNRSKFNHKYLKREDYLVDIETNEKVLVNKMIDSQLRKRTRILKKNNKIYAEKEEYVVVLVNRNCPSLVKKK